MRVPRHDTIYRYKQGCRCDGCVVVYRAAQERYAERNRERAKEWYKANPERARANNQAWKAANPHRTREINLTSYHKRMSENPEQIRKNRREWAKTEQGRLANRLARHDRRGAPSDKEWVEILLQDPCSYCGGPGGEIDHIVPLADGGDGSWENLTAACRTCNAKKNDGRLLQALG